MSMSVLRKITAGWALIIALACGRTGGNGSPPAQDSARPAPGAQDMQARADSLRDGHHTYRDPQGRLIMEGDMLGGRREGSWKSYGPNGHLMSRSEYEGGLLTGVTTVFYPSGGLYYTGENRAGHPTGSWRFYDQHGMLMKVVRYDSTGALLNDR